MDPKAFVTAVEAAWRNRAAMPKGQRLTRLHVHVAAKLAFWRGSNPSHRQLARSARCSTRTVQRALARLHGMGLLSWTRRVLKGRGWRAQIANAYHFLSNASLTYQSLKSPANLSPSGGGGDAAIARDILERRARVIQGRLQERYARFRDPGLPLGA